MSHKIYYDPVTLNWLPNFQDYTIEKYNLHSYMVQKRGEEGVNIVELSDNDGQGSCTCQDFAFRKDPNNTRKTSDISCKHIRMIKCIIRIKNILNK